MKIIPEVFVVVEKNPNAILCTMLLISIIFIDDIAINISYKKCFNFRHKIERAQMDELHRKEIEEYLITRKVRHLTTCSKCSPTSHSDMSGSYNSDGSRPHTPPADIGGTQHLRTIVGKLLELSKDTVPRKKEKLESLNKELQFVHQYLSSGRPYPRGEVPSPMTRNSLSFLQYQPNSDTVQSIVKRVLTAGHERESLIKRSQVDIPAECANEPPHSKHAQDSLHQVMSSTVIQVINHQPGPSPGVKGGDTSSRLDSQTSVEQVQRIKDQLVSSHKSIVERLKRSMSQSRKASQESDQEPGPISLRTLSGDKGEQHKKQATKRQREIHDVLSQSKQQIEKTLQQRSNKSTKEPT